MAGNVVMVKHAGCVPQCAIAFEKLWLEAGAPVGAYTNLLISHDQVAQAIDDPRIKGVALTGSVAAGKLVAARAGQNLKKSTMELGGSDAFIVLEDADLDQTVKWAVWAKMNNMGQCCVAAKRFIVVEELADRFLDRFQTALAALSAGDPMDQATTLGPLSTEAALLHLLDRLPASAYGIPLPLAEFQARDEGMTQAVARDNAMRAKVLEAFDCLRLVDEQNRRALQEVRRAVELANQVNKMTESRQASEIMVLGAAYASDGQWAKARSRPSCAS